MRRSKHLLDNPSEMTYLEKHRPPEHELRGPTASRTRRETLVRTQYQTTADPSTPIDDLDLTIRAEFALKRLGILTLGDLLQKTESDLLRTRLVDRHFALPSIRKQLDERGLRLPGERL